MADNKPLDPLLDLLVQNGVLDDAQVDEALVDQSWRAAAEENRRALFEAGLWGAPTFRVGGAAAHWGQDRLWALEADLRAATGRP